MEAHTEYLIPPAARSRYDVDDICDFMVFTGGVS